ncbi:hypothetical protein B6A10_06185 [Flavobacterium sp. L1I52]|uniref:Uncharacterized protein n=1 Tax=Flavobacterium pokkalii TaxID=1940408 RepID=A0ABR7URX8_9FLAO|nr:hypothetical protein [Flavobacterium pokkalii]MBD0724763.1 hypothetical protein [Flavobacterium pokkalii]
METTKTYPLEWLDSLISITLNPGNNHVCTITADEIKDITEQILKEILYIQTQLNKQIFLFTKESEIKHLIQKYHSSLIILQDIVVCNQNKDVFKSPHLSNIMKTLFNCLDELLTYIESRFFSYLNIDERVPISYLIVTKNELKLKFDCLKSRLEKAVDNKNITDIIFDVFKFSKNNSSLTYREVLYRKKLIQELELFCENHQKANTFSAIDELLVFLNFNNIKYMNYFKRSIIQKIDLFENESDRLDKLLFFLKEFNQLYTKKNICFNHKNRNLKKVIIHWFEQEIIYLEKKMEQSIYPFIENEKKIDNTAGKNIENKITCLLSADQIALFLRAADESRILNAKSMSAVFKTIVPHLSTPFKTELSYQSVRSKSYNAEDKDKEIAIETLEKIIQKIKSY